MIKVTINALSLPVSLLSQLRRVDEFNGAWKATQLLAPDRLSSLKHVATIESIGASTRIEGVTLSNIEIETLLRNLTSTSFRTRDEQEVAGYSDAMNVIFDAYGDFEISENHLKQLHGILLKYSEKDERHRGDYKTSSNSVGAFEDGKLKAIIFDTASPFETPLLMGQLIKWYEDVCQKDWHPLVIIGVFIVVFLAIHPFQDGNGRLSRALTTLLLLKFQYAYVPYVSLEGIIEDNKADYYKALQRTQRTLRSAEPDFVPWLTFFFSILEKQMETLRSRIEETKLIQHLPQLSVNILEAIQNHQRLSVSQLSDLLGMNRNTIRNHVYELLRDKRLAQHGEGRGVFYTMPIGSS